MVLVVGPSPMARLVVVPTLVAATTCSIGGGLVEAPILAAAPAARSGRLVEAPTLA